MDNDRSICAGCIWEDDCRAAHLCSTDCDFFDSTIDDIAYDAIMYYQDLAERYTYYLEQMEEEVRTDG